FIGQGLSNVAGCFFSAYTSSGSFNRSGANFAAGARTPLAAAMSAVFLLLIALLAAPLVAFLPVSAMAAILFIVAWGLVDFRHVGQILKRHPRERTIWLLTFVGTLVDLEKGIFLGILVSLAFYLYSTSRPLIQERAPPSSELSNLRRKLIDVGPDAPGCPQLAMLAVHGSIFFGAVDHVRNHLRSIDEADPRRKWVFVLAQGVNFVDLAGAQMLAQEARRLRALGGGLFLVAAQARMLRAMIEGGEVEAVGRDRFIAHKGDALRAVYPLLDSEICRHCKVRAFQECHEALPSGEPRPPAETSDTANERKTAP
ncbi:MAG: SulP family inorganic anion transporter, partial [Rubrivivax sp.]|nr:SulP family inorganic anion transporter [Rubrivivax sp.]